MLSGDLQYFTEIINNMTSNLQQLDDMIVGDIHVHDHINKISLALRLDIQELNELIVNGVKLQESLERGLIDSAEGRIQDLGSFEGYFESTEDETSEQIDGLTKPRQRRR